jgi:hypothetical protein
VWKQLADRAEAEKAVLCEHYEGKALYTVSLHLLVGIPREINETLLREEAKSNEEVREHKIRKRSLSLDEGIEAKKSNCNAGIRIPRPQVPTRN